jgi:hypothetical protein
MADVVYLLLIAAFFALAAFFVKACEAIIGPDELAAPGRAGETKPESLAP